MNKNKIISILFIVLTTVGLAAPLRSQPLVAPSAFATKTDGAIIYAADWNNVIGGLYTYITYTLLPQLNVLTTAGDMYYFGGTNLARLPIGTTGQVMTVAGGLPTWAAGLGLPLTTKGDLVGYTGSAVARQGVGTNGQVLTADSTQTNGISWANPANLQSAPGMIIMYNQTYGGSIPSGWVLCDGTNGTPNMIGMVPIGGQASSGSATANANGYGNTVYGNAYGSTLASGSVSVSGTTSTSNSNNNVIQGSGANGTSGPWATGGHAHTYSGSGSFAVTNQPATMSLIFIQKT